MPLNDSSASPELLPASFGQRRLWFLEQLAPGSPQYHIPFLLRLRGPLDREALGLALAAVVGRHEALRTTFTGGEGGPFQVIGPRRRPELPVEDLSALPPGRRGDERDRLVRREAARPFDLGRDLLLRVRLVHLGPDEHALVLVLHHLAADGWSMAILQRDLGQAYAAFRAGASPEWEPLPLQYADYASWQHEYLQGGVLERLLTYWRGELAGAPPFLSLPGDHPRPAVASRRGALEAASLPPALVGRLRGLAREQRATLYMALLAGFSAVLHHQSGEDDLVIGSTLAGRDAAETEDLVGFFVNTVPLRIRLGGDPDAGTLLARLREAVLGAFEHRALPFERLVEDLQPARDPGRDPVCQVHFALQNQPSAPLRLDGLEISLEPVHTGTAKADLSVAAVEEADGSVTLTAEYATDLFSGPTIARLLGQVLTVLAAWTEDPLRPLSALPLLTAKERAEVLGRTDESGPVPGADETAVPALARQAALDPGAAALLWGDERWSRAELGGRVDRLAGVLRARGVGPEVLVAVCLDRSPDLLVALLAVHRAGGAYVPLDPAYPAERLAFVLADSGARLLLTQRRLRGRLPAADVLCLDEPLGEAELRVDPAAVAPESLAYVLYTSGSTGRPKGVMVTHANLANFFAGMDRVLGPGPGTWLAVTSVSFDISVLELLWTLARGWTVVLRSEAAPDAAFAVQVQAHRVTHLQCTPSFARLLLGSPETAAAIGSLACLVVGGEALTGALARALLATGLRRLVNAYGPTETTVWSAVQEVDAAAAAGDAVALGRALAGQHLYVLDARGQPRPTGLPGELWISGGGVARGYWNRPELTAERFRPDPFRPGLRMYRTGDLGRRRADGVTEFLGRADHQVKLRGHRIEPGEIEAALARHPDVRAAAVVLRSEEGGEPELVAYLEAGTGPGAAPAPETLRAFLARDLPPVMVPSAFVVLDRLPLTPNGKVDRAALPAPARPAGPAPAAAPADGLEAAIAAVWCGVLRVTAVGADENFFDAGGHSLQVVQVRARLREVLGRDVSVLELFQHPTVRALARHLAAPAAAPGDVRERAEARMRARSSALAFPAILPASP